MQRPDVTVAVRPAAALHARPRLFGALEAAFGVRFVPDDAGADALVLIGAGAAAATIPSLQVLDDDRPPVVTEARLADHPGVDRRLRGISLPLAFVTDGLAVEPGEDVLAEAEGNAVWTRSERRVPAHRVASAVPELGATEVLRTTLAGPRALAIVALVHFLRSVTGPLAGEPAPTRAAFLFDDPNLRRPSYGFIDFDALAAHADAHGYHAAMAMIPLDARWQHRATVELFKRRSDRLSLVFHGNNHSRRELLEIGTRTRAEALAAQAVRRMAAFERRWGLAVDRVMTAPHGMCSEHMADALGAVGFDALCAIHPVPWSEQPPPDRILAGWEPAEFPAGCAVIPRFPLGSSAADIALLAFLDQPIVLYGHHEDVAGGLEPLADAAARVNRLGSVEWTSLASLVRQNHAVRTDAGIAVVRMFGGVGQVQVPPDARAVVVERPRGSGDAFAGWSLDGGPVMPFEAPVASEGATGVEIRLRPRRELAPAAVRPPAWSPWPLLRRAATEARDRSWPLRGARRARGSYAR